MTQNRSNGHSRAGGPGAPANTSSSTEFVASAAAAAAEARTLLDTSGEGDAAQQGRDALRAALPVFMHTTTRRRPRPFSPVYHRVRGTGLTLLLVPVALLVSMIEAVRSAVEWLDRARGGELEQRFNRPAAMPAPAERSVADIVSSLKRFPFRPTRMSTHRAFYRDFGPEGLGIVLGNQQALIGLPHIYPSHFKPVLLMGADGERIAGMQAMHHTPGPALIICHGFLTSKHFDYIRQIACRAYFGWGFHVITMDLRSWGQTAWTSEAPSSVGWAEGRDVLEIATALKADGLVTSVGALGFSLGGSTVLNAAHAASLEDPEVLDGGVLALSAPTDMRAALEHISTRPHWRDPYALLYFIFHSALRSGLRARGIDNRMRSWAEVTERFTAPWYGVPVEEYHARASAVNFAGAITVPTLEIHAEDDFVVPPEHARNLRDAAVDNPNLDVWIVERGNHCAFGSVDKVWYHSVVRRWFEYWADEAP